MRKPAFSDLVDIVRLQELMDQFYDLTSIPVGILDPEGEILVATGWQDVCTKFHRVNPETEKRCRESDAYINTHLHDGGYVGYKCKNGLWDVAVPIIVFDRHLATMFCGQFFYEDEVVDEDSFREQARRFGFDEEQYLAALNKAPVFSRERVEIIMRYYVTFVGFLSTLGHHNLRLSEEVEERKAAEKQLQLSESRFRTIYDEAPVLIQSVDEHATVRSVNNKWLNHLGYESGEALGRPFSEFLSKDSREECAASLSRLWSEGRTDNVSLEFVTKDGRILETLVDSAVVMDSSWGRVGLSVVRDVTAQRRAERALREAHEDLERQVAERTRDLQESVRLLSKEVDQRKRAELQLGEANQFKSKLLAASPVGILTCKASGQCVSANEAAASAMGMTVDDLVSKNLFELEPWISSGLLQDVEDILSKGVEKQVELRVEGEGAEDMFLDCTLTGFAAKNEAHLLIITHDISERKRFERELQQSLDFLRIRDRIAGIFLATSDKDMFSEVLDVALEEVGSPLGVFGYIDEDGAMVCPSMPRTVLGQCQTTDKAVVFPRETWSGLWGQALTKERTHYSNQPSRVPEGHLPIFNHVAVPLVCDKELVGVL